MNFTRMIKTVDSHTAGNPTRVIVSGIGRIPGSSLLEKRDFLWKHRDHFRTLLVHEPRGGALMCAVLLLEPCDENADVSVVIMEQDEYPPMCGHCMIGTAMTLVELGLVEREVPVTRIVIEAPAGLIELCVAYDGDKVGDVTLTNVASYLAEKDVPLTLTNGEEITIDVAYGGEFYACAAVDQFSFEIKPKWAAEIAQAANLVREAVSGRRVPHPTRPDINRVYNVMFFEKVAERPLGYRNVVVCPPGEIDRSPCGTGTSALMARSVALGELGVGEVFVNEGILGTSFNGMVRELTTLGSAPAVIPEVTGRAYITGFHEFVLDPDDPFSAGFQLR